MQIKPKQICLVFIWAMVLVSAYCIYASLLHASHHTSGLDHRFFCAAVLFMAAFYQWRFCTTDTALPLMVKLAVVYACGGMVYGLYELLILI